MARSASKTVTLDLPAQPDPDQMPIRYGCRAQLAVVHHRYWGPVAPRSLERWNLEWIINNGRAVCDIRKFIAEAERRFAESPRDTRGMP